jgi:hypothetical protein
MEGPRSAKGDARKRLGTEGLVQCPCVNSAPEGTCLSPLLPSLGSTWTFLMNFQVIRSARKKADLTVEEAVIDACTRCGGKVCYCVNLKE